MCWSYLDNLIARWYVLVPQATSNKSLPYLIIPGGNPAVHLRIQLELAQRLALTMISGVMNRHPCAPRRIFPLVSFLKIFNYFFDECRFRWFSLRDVIKGIRVPQIEFGIVRQISKKGSVRCTPHRPTGHSTECKTHVVSRLATGLSLKFCWKTHQ